MLNEVLSTEENVLSAYIDDQIERRKSVHSFVRLLSSVEGAHSISLVGEWGAGKTFFLKQIKMVLDALNPYTEQLEANVVGQIKNVWSKEKEKGDAEDNPVVTVYFDAWEHDDEEDPILSLVYDIVRQGFGEDSFAKYDVGSILASIVDIICPVALGSALKTIQKKDDLKKIKTMVGLNERIRTFISTLMPERGNKLVVFIDELDRCTPTYAVRLLERIKHYFTIENVIFVFAINQSELQNTIKRFYGEGFDSCQYLDRFFDLKIGLPAVDKRTYIINSGLSSITNLREKVCFEMIKQKNMSLRTISRYLQLSKIATSKYTDSERKLQFFQEKEYAYKFALGVVVPVAIGLLLTDYEEYQALIDGKSSKWIENVMRADDYDWLLDVPIVNREALIKEAYKVIFDDAVHGSEYGQVRVGRFMFEQGIRKIVTDAIGLVSPYSDYSV